MPKAEKGSYGQVARESKLRCGRGGSQGIPSCPVLAPGRNGTLMGIQAASTRVLNIPVAEYQSSVLTCKGAVLKNMKLVSQNCHHLFLVFGGYEEKARKTYTLATPLGNLR